MLSTEDGKIVPRQPIQDQSLWVRDDFNANNDWKMPIPLDVVTDIEAALTGLKQKALHPRGWAWFCSTDWISDTAIRSS